VPGQLQSYIEGDLPYGVKDRPGAEEGIVECAAAPQQVAPARTKGRQSTCQQGRLAPLEHAMQVDGAKLRAGQASPQSAQQVLHGV
jgi:hypothetical protein